MLAGGGANIRMLTDKDYARPAGIRIPPSAEKMAGVVQSTRRAVGEKRRRNVESPTKRKRKLTREKIIDEFCGHGEMVI